MATLKVSGLSKSFGIETIFENVSFEIRSGERIGLVGSNGAGKSTLLKCMTGREEADKGSVKADDGAVIGYLRQDFAYTRGTIRGEMEEAWKDVLYYQDKIKELTERLSRHDEDYDRLLREYGRAEERFEFLGGYGYESAARRILTGLGFTDADWDRDIHAFSGGQKVRINLAVALVRHPDFLLLDEPTNHLDMDMLEWLEDCLRSYRGGVLVVSHDRYFLDNVATGIIDLARHHIRTFRGNYSNFVKVKAEQDAAYEKAYEKQQEHIKETEEYIRRYKAGIKSKQARGRQSQLNRLERMEAPVHESSLHFHFDPPDECAEKVLDVMDVEASYGSHVIFDHLEMHIKNGETVGLIGPNGAGKSTLLKLITGDKKPDHGFIQLGNRVKPGYYSQEQDRLNGNFTVLEQIMNDFGYGEDEARRVLGMFLFRGDDVFRQISLLSGGEKARLSLLCLFLERPNFLILDEPTNHLDIPTREIMEDALRAFGGTALVVSHDRYFLDKVTTRILEMEEGKLTEYLGNYTYYKDKKKDLLAFEADRKIQEAPETRAKEKDAPDAEPQPARREKKDISAGDAAKLEHMEMEISRMEATLKMYELEMNQPGTEESRLTELAAAYEADKKKLNDLYASWEALSEKVE